MMHAPSHHEILLAEQRLIRSRRELAAGTVRLSAAVRATLAKPATLLGVACAAGVAGFLMFRRPSVRVELPDTSNASTAANAAGATSLAGIIVAFATRYAMRRLPGIGLRLVEDAIRKQRTAPRPSYPSGTSLH